ncbi:MAG: hypothetical protein AAF721_14975 [Myxococcota bacterium]
MRRSLGLALVLSAPGCATGADGNGHGAFGVGHGDGATAWDPAGGSDETGSGDDATGGGTSGSTSGGGDSESGVDASDSSEGSSEGGDDNAAVVGDPQCPPGFLVALDVTDGLADDLGNGCSWIPSVLMSESTRISVEVWGGVQHHYGPTIFDLSGHEGAIEQFAICNGSLTPIMSEDGSYRLTLDAGRSAVILTDGDDQVGLGASLYRGVLANAHVAHDEVLGVGYTDATAWSDNARYFAGDRWVTCYDPSA